MATHTDGNRKGTDFFNESEIGDTDGDGMKEILDAWGNPIEFLRWAPGLRSLIQDGDTALGDPFNPQRAHNIYHPNTFPLHPYVYSAGPDGAYDTVPDWVKKEEEEEEDDSLRLHYSTTTPKNNPYYVPEGEASQLGTERDTNGDGVNNFIDNISNHKTVTRPGA